MQLSEWSVLLLLLKLASYIAIAGLAGTLLMRFMCGNSNVAGHHLISFYQFLKRW